MAQSTRTNMSRKISECGEDLCPVCSEVVTIYSVGKCGHVICYRCSTRMRVLCELLYCAICRSDLPEVAYVGKPGKLTDYDLNNFRCNKRAQVFFEREEYEKAFLGLLEHRCVKCSQIKPFRNFAGLKEHMRKDHGLQYCDLCVKHIKLFSQERKSYTRQQLAQHRRVGDADDKSHKGHPLCQFCDDRYLDNDELLRHLRKDHYFCHFCDADGITNQFYGEYLFLKDHFRDSHYLCEEGECIEAEFTNAFRSEIDYKAHMSSLHSKGLRKSQARQARTLDIDINLTPRYSTDRRRDRDRGLVSGADYAESRPERKQGRGRGLRQQRAKEREEIETAQAISASLSEVQRHGHVNVLDEALVRPRLEDKPNSGSKENLTYEKRTDDFPALDGKTLSDSESSDDNEKKSGQSRDTLAKKFAAANKFSVSHGSMGDEDFPTLGGASVKPSQKYTQSVWNSAKDFPPVGVGRGRGGGTRAPPPLSQAPMPPPAAPSLMLNFGTSDFPSLRGISNGLLASSQPPASVKSKPTSKPAEPKDIDKPSPKTNTASKPARTSHYPPKSSHSMTPTVPKTSLANDANLTQLYSKDTSDLAPATSKSKGQAQNVPFSVNSLDNYTDLIAPKSESIKLVKGDFPSLAQPKSSAEDKKISSSKPPKSLQDDFPALGKASNSHAPPSWGPKVSSSQPVHKEADAEQFVTVKLKTNKKKKKNPQDKVKGSIPGSDCEGSEGELDKFSSPTRNFALLEDLKEKENKKKEVKVSEPTNKKSKAKQEKSGKSTPKPKEDNVNGTKGTTDIAKDITTEVSENNVLSAVEDFHTLTLLKDQSNLPHSTTKDITTEISEKKVLFPVEDFPALTLLKDQRNLPHSTSEISEKKVSSPVEDFPALTLPKDQSSLSPVILTSNDFPELSAGIPTVSTIARPPPGVQLPPGVHPPSGKKPPPGFAPAASAPPPGFSKPPPGFTMPSIHYESEVPTNTTLNDYNSAASEEASETPENGEPVIHYSYAQPQNFAERNQMLLTAIQEYTSSGNDFFLMFKKASGEYRRGELSAKDYYNKCASLIGLDNFLLVFPELLALLPDIPKQQELLDAHSANRSNANTTNGKKNKKGKSWTPQDATFKTCSVCGQVLTNTDFLSHMDLHSLDQEFPSLGAVPSNPHGLSAWIKQ